MAASCYLKLPNRTLANLEYRIAAVRQQKLQIPSKVKKIKSLNQPRRPDTLQIISNLKAHHPGIIYQSDIPSGVPTCSN